MAHIDEAFAKAVQEEISSLLEQAIDKMKTSSEDVSLVLVGGGGIIVPERFGVFPQL